MKEKYQELLNVNEALANYIKKNDCRVVRDHCHFTGKFRGAAHNHCNRQYRKTYKIPVFMHNLKRYDGHIVFENLAKLKLNKSPKVMAKALESFLSIKVGTLEFKDSLQFLNSSLDKLVKNLKDKGVKEGKTLKDTFPNTYAFFKKKFQHLNEESIELLTRKGVYPYKFMDNFQKFEKTELPSRDDFTNDLTKKKISDDDWDFVNDLWKTFQLKNLGELHDLYMETDTLLLADVFENYRKVIHTNYELDPIHFYTAPSLSWSAGLKYTGVKLEIPTDVNIHMFIDRGLRGGISMVANHFAKANNSMLPPEFYDKDTQQSFIKFVDANNLYGWAMSQFLPTGGFKWVKWIHGLPTDDPAITLDGANTYKSMCQWEEEIKRLDDKSSVGYIFEVDLEYPQHLRLDEKHDNFPLAPESFKIGKELLSPYQKELGDELDVKYGSEKIRKTTSATTVT